MEIKFWKLNLKIEVFVWLTVNCAQPSSGEQSIKITVSTNQNFCYNSFEIQ